MNEKPKWEDLTAEEKEKHVHAFVSGLGGLFLLIGMTILMGSCVMGGCALMF